MFIIFIGYRGQNASALFRIAEVDSDDDQSPGSRPASPRTPAPGVPADLVSIVPTPVNGSRDSLADSLRDPADAPLEPRLRSGPRRHRRASRLGLPRSDSSESPPPKDAARSSPAAVAERLSPEAGYNRTVARLMNETNESELESSCSTESGPWPQAGPSAATASRRHDASDDHFLAAKFRQRIKKTRRNYRNHVDSDSN